jgi:hypothetical protein
MAAVTVEATLQRVEEDLAAGHLSLARQRLRGLVGSYPQRLDLREQLADLYRRDGVVSQAGRWSYLSEHRDENEVRAFEREYSDPVHRMRALAWKGPEDAAGPAARERLSALRRAAEQQVGRAVAWGDPASAATPTTWGDRAFTVGVLVLLALIVLGGISFLMQGIATVLDWLGG